MIQIAIDEHDQPHSVTYAQHRTGVRAAYPDVELAQTPNGLVPVIYSARGSHAAMLRAGHSRSHRSVLADHNDGHGPRRHPTLVVLSGTTTPWFYWPGQWGSTRATSPTLGKFGAQANSPTAATHHKAWTAPDAFDATCDLVELPPVGETHPASSHAPSPPELSVSREDGKAIIHVSVEPAADGTRPPQVVLSTHYADGLPPVTQLIAVPTGTATIEHAIDTDGPLEIRAAAATADGASSPTTSTRATP